MTGQPEERGIVPDTAGGKNSGVCGITKRGVETGEIESKIMELGMTEDAGGAKSSSFQPSRRTGGGGRGKARFQENRAFPERTKRRLSSKRIEGSASRRSSDVLLKGKRKKCRGSRGEREGGFLLELWRK